MGIKIYFAVSLLLIIFDIVASDDVVLTTTGPIRGIQVQTKHANVAAFLGIPYAEPPVGELRFRKPVPVRPWDDVYNATKKSFPCCQNATEKFYWMPDTENMTEDCLYLNIWVPDTLIQKKEKKPMTVMVWIYGGAFNLGSSDMNVYDGAELAAYGQVIIASLNYRIGVFGFLTALIDDANGNMGIYDQLLALKWLKQNIAVFGGDPEEIVLFGESAGAMSIALHLISPLTRNLFKRAILQSGAGIHPMSFEATKRHIATSNSIAKIVKCADHQTNITTHPQRVVDCLKRVPFKELTRAEGIMMKINPITFYPRWGDDYLPSETTQALHEFQYKNTELLIGVNRDEGALFLITALPDYFGIYGKNGVSNVSKRLAKALIKGMFRVTEQKNGSEIANFYIDNIEDPTSEKYKKAIYTTLGDYMITCNSIFFSDLYSRKHNKVYFYVFTHRPSATLTANWTGVNHFDEVQYVFGHPIVDNSSFTTDEETLSRRIMDRWIAFAKTGNPNIHGEIKWPAYSHKYPVYLDMNVAEEIRKHPSGKRCEFWRDRFMAQINTTEVAERLVDYPNESSITKVTLHTIVLELLVFIIFSRN